MKDKKDSVLVVYKKSVFELYSSSPDKEVRDYANQSTPEAEKMRKSHEEQQRTLETIVKTLEKLGIPHEEMYRAHLKGKGHVDDRSLVIAVGGDGTFLEVSHYIKGARLLGVNSDTNGSTGFFSTATRHSFEGAMAAIDGTATTRLNRLELTLDGTAIPELVLNDILIAHVSPAAMTRYKVIANGEQKDYRSSGLLVCTAAGSTAWMYNEGGDAMPFGSDKMQYLSRGIRGEKPRLADTLKIISATREGRLYLDGEHLQYDFTLGSTLELRKGIPLHVVGSLEEKRANYTG